MRWWSSICTALASNKSLTQQIILLTNTGSPRTADEEDVRRYLQEFLTDGDIISVPYLMRQLLVRGIIVPRRTHFSSERYRRLLALSDGVMPLTAEMQRLAEQVAQLTQLPTLYTPRYTQTSRAQWGERIAQLVGTDDVEVLLLPLFPQYTRSNAGSAITYFSDLPKPTGGHYKTSVLTPWGTDPHYIQQLSEVLQSHVNTSDSTYHYIASYHSIPEAHLKYDQTHGWDYHAQCVDTLQALTHRLGVPEERVHLTFHSAMGHGRWLQPTLVSVLQELAAQGVRRIVLFSPSFVADCLETKLDLQLEARDLFLAAGGEELIYVPCLSTHPDSGALIASLVERVQRQR